MSFLIFAVRPCTPSYVVNPRHDVPEDFVASGSLVAFVNAAHPVTLHLTVIVLAVFELFA